jgi:hypothetical protein
VASQSAPLRTSWFTFSAPALLRPRLHLYADRLELQGWRWLGRYRRAIPLRRVLQVDATDGRLLVWLVDGTTLRLCVDDAPAWRDAVDGRL